MNSAPQYKAARGRRTGSNNSGVGEIPREKYNLQTIVHMIAQARLHLRRNQEVNSAHVRIRYTRYAVQVATETEKTTYYLVDRMKKTTRRKKKQYLNRKNHKPKREEREKLQFRQQIKKS